VSLANALHLYRVRLRARILPECFALVGIAAGVALLFAAQVSSSSLQSSVAQLQRGIAGRATLQLLARGAEGFGQATLKQVRALPGVRAAAPLLEVSAQAHGPRGSAGVQLIGADESLAALGGALTHGVQLAPFAGVGAIVLPAPLAQQLGVTRFGQEATLALAGRTATAALYTQLHANQIGALVHSPVAIVPLAFAQEISGLRGRVSRIFVQPARGSEARVRAGLQRLAAGALTGDAGGLKGDGGGHAPSAPGGYALNVQGIGYDQTLFATAATANNSATALFAAIGALVGFLLAFNATLLTVAQRRRMIAALRREGYSAATVTALLALDALALGAAACVLGLALGQELSIHFLHANPAFLSLAFVLGSQRAVSAQDIAVAVGGGMLAAFVSVLGPLCAARAPGARARGPQARGLSARIRSVRALNANGWLTLAAALCLAGASAILLAAPAAPIPGMVLLVAALLLALGPALAATLALLARLARGVRGVALHVAVIELRAARTRALAIAATGAVAVFGSVAIAGAHHDLLAGLDRTMRALNAPADIWVAPVGSYNLMLTSPFAATQRAALARVPGVRAVALYRGGLLDYGARRVLVVAPPAASGAASAPSGAESASPGVGPSTPGAGLAVPAAGELTLSRALAAEHHLRVGQTVTLPSPRPQTLRVAALTDNLGWAPGAIVMSAADYARAWGSADASAYAVSLIPGAAPQRVIVAIRRALGPAAAALSVETSARHSARQQALSAGALARLTQIATLIPLVAVLAMAAALGAMIWQRRPQLAQLRLQGIARATLWRTLLLESVLLLGVGCSLGAAFGLYAQRLADSALVQVVNFPVAPAALAPVALRTPAAVVLTALLMLLLPGYLAARAPAALALAE
jgi:putative ABC transport system permease protein